VRITPACVLLWTITWASAQSAKATSAEQTHFSAEDEGVQRRTPVPDGVLAIISKDEDVQSALESEGESQLPNNWLSASVVHLKDPDENDVVVMAVGILRGANVNRFWVFRPIGSGRYQTILNGPAHDLVIKNSRSNGYRDIKLLSATAVAVSTLILKFDGIPHVQSEITTPPLMLVPTCVSPPVTERGWGGAEHDRIVRSGQRLDGVWFLLHESCAILCWHFIGIWADVGRMRSRVMIGYLAVRLLLDFNGAYEIGGRIQVLFWFCLMLYFAFLGTSRLVRLGLRAAKRTWCAERRWHTPLRNGP
jgi:hypothetical protein